LNLHCFSTVPGGTFRTEKFGFGCRHTVGTTLVFKPGRVHIKETGSININCHIGYKPLNGLLTGNGLFELHPFLGVFHRFIQATLGYPGGHSSDPYTANIQSTHSNLEALPLLSQQTISRYYTVFKHHF
jgi:hypothetical protein